MFSENAISNLNSEFSALPNLLKKTLAGSNRIYEQLPLLSKISYAELQTYTLDVLLRDTDQMSMASALEVRVPFFDHRLVEYSISVPDSIKRPQSQKQLLVESLGDLLPREVVDRKKMGFVFPWEKWLRNELKAFVEERINNLANRQIFDGGAIKNVYQQFKSGDKRILWVHIWLLVVLEKWMEQNSIDG